ncbi:hypothetical protein AVEN_109634-1 [Araneus ventricosus]|uniref:Uncharacterized protein n=1 Tax=Araneus ventricosus TaxID=182803 RepID=A0A4Y2JH43_ARAVE|nr:hypothetical protein AVEN_109634-1 [Araneus ventricosus]
MTTPYEKEMECLRKLLAEVEIDEDSDFDNEDNGHGDVLEENFSDHECFSEHDTEESEILEMKIRITWNSFHQKMAYSAGKQNLSRIFVISVLIFCRAYLEQKDQRKI